MLDPDMLMSDFELALIQATALNFPTASHKGCYYHFYFDYTGPRTNNHVEGWHLHLRKVVG